MSHHQDHQSGECPYDDEDIEDLCLKILGTFQNGMHVGLILDALTTVIADVIIENLPFHEALDCINDIKADMDEIPFYLEETQH